MRMGLRGCRFFQVGAALLGGAALLLSAFPLAAQTKKAAAPGKTTPPAKTTAKASATKSPTKKPKRTVRRARGQQTPSPERIREIQQALAREGHYQNEPSGKWDAATIAAMKSFQQANGLKPDGRLGARTLQKLGLGSQVAGVAPPRGEPATDSPVRP